MFQLYKKRGFNELISDTFDFFKVHGKNYFINYFIINGGFLLILVVLLFFFMKIFFEGIFSSMSNGGSENVIMENMMANMTLFIASGILMVLLIILISIISYAFPVGYLKLIESKKELTTKNLIHYIKANIGKSILFYLGSLITFLPVFLIVFAVVIALMFVLIGIPLLFIVLPAFTSWISLSYYDYISTNNSFLTSIGEGLNMLKENFWANIGATVIMYIIVQIVVGIVYFVPYIIGIAGTFTNPEALAGGETEAIEALSFMMIMMSIALIVSILFNYMLQNLLLINQGMIYYSSKEAQENKTIINNIDLIGNKSE